MLKDYYIVSVIIALFSVLFGQNLLEFGSPERRVFYAVGEAVVLLMMAIPIHYKIKSPLSAFLMWFLVGFAINRAFSIFLLFGVNNDFIIIGRWQLWEILLAVGGALYTQLNAGIKRNK